MGIGEAGVRGSPSPLPGSRELLVAVMQRPLRPWQQASRLTAAAVVPRILETLFPIRAGAVVGHTVMHCWSLSWWFVSRQRVGCIAGSDAFAW